MLKSNILSLENNFISACKILFGEQKVQFFMLDKLDNLENLNNFVLPKIKKIIEEEDLFFEGDVINYDLTKLQINKYVKHDNASLELELQYFSQKFQLKLKLDNNLTNDSYAEAFQQLVATKIANQIIFYEWETKQQHFTKVKNKIKNILETNNSLLFINTQKVTLEYNKLSIIAFNNSQISQKNLKFEYEYDDSDLWTINILLVDYISSSEFLDTWDNLTQDKLIINLSPAVTLENIWEDLKLNHWIGQIVDFFKNKQFQIRKTKFEIKAENIYFPETVDLNKFSKIVPAIKKIALQIKYKIDQSQISLNVTFKLNNEIDQERFKKAFFDKIKELQIDGKDFINAQNNSIIHNYIAKEVIDFFENKIIFNGIKFFINTKNFLVSDYLIDYKNNKPIITVQCESDLFTEKVFEIEVSIVNFEMFMFNKIVKFLQQFKQSTPFDLNYQFNEENTWNDLLNEVKKKITISEFEKNIINKITWSGYYKSNLNIKIKDDDFKGEVWKTVVIKYNNQTSSSVDIHFKNLRFLKDYIIIENIKKSLQKTYKSNWDGVYMPLLSVGQEQSTAYLGIGYIDPLLKKSEVTSKFIIKSINRKKGEVVVTLHLQTSQERSTMEILITNFATSSWLFTKIKNYFKDCIPYDTHLLGTNDSRSLALDTFKRLTKKELENNYHNISSFGLRGSMTDKIINTWKDNGDWFYVDVTIGDETQKIDFCVKDVNDYQMDQFIKNFPKVLYLEKEYQHYPAHRINKTVSLPQLGLGKYVWENSTGLEINFVATTIDYQSGEVKLKGYVFKYYRTKDIKTIQRTFNISIKNYWNDDIFKQKLLTYFSQEFDYPRHGITTAMTRKQAFGYCTSLFKAGFSDSFYGITKFNFLGQENISVVNTKGNHGDVFEVLLDFGNTTSFKLTIKLKNVIEGDIITLKNQIRNAYRTSKENFWAGVWKVGQIIQPKDLGVEWPNNLLGCKVELKIKSINGRSVLFDLKISKNSTQATFEHNVYGFKLYSVYLDELQKWMKRPSLSFGTYSVNGALKLSNTWEDLVNYIKKSASQYFKVSNLDHIDFFINDRNINHKTKKISDLIITHFPKENFTAAYIKDYFFSYKDNRNYWETMDKSKAYGFRDFAK